MLIYASCRERQRTTTELSKRRQKDLKILKKVLDKSTDLC